MKPVRVLHVFGILNKGGAESRTMDIYRNIDRSKVQFDFMTHYAVHGFFEEEILSFGGKVYHEVPPYRIYNFFAYLAAWNRFFQQCHYHTIHIHTTNSAIPILLAAKKNNIPVRICHSRSAGEASALRRLLAKMSRKWIREYSTDLFAVSEEAGKFCFGQSDFKVIKNAVDIKKFEFDKASRIEYRAKFNLNDSYVVGHVGSFLSGKNHLFLLEAFAQAIAERPGMKLILTGDGSLRDKIEEKINELNLEPFVELLGVRDDVPEILQAFDLMVFPSFYEGFPGAVLEAQASGLSVLMSDMITKEVMVCRDLVTALPINRGVGIWAEAIIAKSEQPSIRTNTYGEIAKAGYDIDSVAKWYEKFYTGMQNT